MAQGERLAEIVQSIAIDAPITRVFAALTEPDQVVQWQGSDDTFHIIEMNADVRVGGAWETIGVTAAGDRRRASGVYRVVDPPRALEMTFSHDFAGPEVPVYDTTVRYDLEERNGRTILTLTHSGIANPYEREGMAESWQAILAWLAAWATR
ncbi:MAG TPA: SRPBCC domain-containing protein [Candidatus Elarobacter sp.]|nr:SRPBCC domain-containing protein [Candidatus Elarobacter sp.]